ncbi:Protein CBG25776 [Caenorhabditis briggsae]|uniref:Protein CBG25776 n=1 Tax=Caenorhabditis briggsae TaxID=6238 RepID=B6IGJ9_CAEBR|nr:Protein CBG25776 [Caenorhabditis briggsae]CAR99029.1 Protein CBG25776 [Caenorhabditis briggsae]
MLSISPPAPGATFPKRSIHTMSGFSIWVELNEQKFRENHQNCTESQLMQKMKYFWRAKMLNEEKQEFNRLCEQRKREIEMEKTRLAEERLREKNPNYVCREIQQRPRIAAPRARREEFVQKLDEQWNQLPEDTKKPFLEKYQEIRNAQNENQQGQRMSPPAYFPSNSRPNPLQETQRNFQQQNPNQNSRQMNFQEPEMNFQQNHNQNSRQTHFEESRIPEIRNSQNIPQGIPVRIVKIRRVVLKNQHGQRIQNHGNGNLRFVSKNPQNHGPRLEHLDAPEYSQLDPTPENDGFNHPEEQFLTQNGPKLYKIVKNGHPVAHNNQNHQFQNSRAHFNGSKRPNQDFSNNYDAPEYSNQAFEDFREVGAFKNAPEASGALEYAQNGHLQYTVQNSNAPIKMSNAENYPEYGNQESEAVQKVPMAPDVKRRRVNETIQIHDARRINRSNNNYQYSDSEASTSSEYTSNSENSKFSPISHSCQTVQRNVNQYGQNDQCSNSIAQPEAPKFYWSSTDSKNAPEDAPGFSEEFKSEFDAYQKFQMEPEFQNSNAQAPENEFLTPDAPKSFSMDSEFENSNLEHQENEFSAPDAPKSYSRKYENWPTVDPNERILFDLPDGPIWM